MGGRALLYLVRPELPPGLRLHPFSGTISGGPTRVAAPANYTVTALNWAGTTTVSLNISVIKDVPAWPEMSCAGILHLDIADTQITEAVLIDANSTNSVLYPDAGYLHEHCLVRGIVKSRNGIPAPAMDEYGNLTPAIAAASEYGISFELRMPTTTWNGDFFFTGGSGNDGTVTEAVGATLGGGTAFPPALYRGFAVVTQDWGMPSKRYQWRDGQRIRKSEQRVRI